MGNREFLKVEYLVAIKKKGNFCDRIETFLNFLRADSRFSISKTSKTIKYEAPEDEALTIGYEFQLGEVKEQRVFHIKLFCNSSGENLESDLSRYQKFLRAFRTNIQQLDIEFHVIWDDISLYYAEKAYPLIHEIENLMRKLIMKFMVTKLGLGWVDETVPKQIKDIISRKEGRREGQTNFLYQIDFLDLSKFLLEPYSNSEILELRNKLGRIKDLSELSLDYLNGFVPKSNWQRYFSTVIFYDGERFKRKWDDLYQLRNKIAHNNTFTSSDYKNVVEIVDELGKKIREAVDKLDQVIISEDEREEVAESISININSLYGEFVQNWKVFEKEVSRVLGSSKPVDKRMIPVRWKIDQLEKLGLVRPELCEQFRELNEIRNYLVHSTEDRFTPEEISQFIVWLKTLIDELESLQSSEEISDKNIDVQAN